MKKEMLEKVLNAHKNLIVEGDNASGKTTNVLFSQKFKVFFFEFIIISCLVAAFDTGTLDASIITVANNTVQKDLNLFFIISSPSIY